MRPSPGHLAYSDKLAVKRETSVFIGPLTEQRSQARGSLKESGSLDGIVMAGIHRHINKRFPESVKPSASWRIRCLCSHYCDFFSVIAGADLKVGFNLARVCLVN